MADETRIVLDGVEPGGDLAGIDDYGPSAATCSSSARG